MFKTRKKFLVFAIGLAACGWGAVLIAQNPPQIQLPRPGVPFPTGPLGPLGEPTPEPRRDPEKQLRQNDAEIKKDMAKLTQLVGELQKEFDANNSTKVLSISAVRKTEEIEKLAKDIRNLLRG